MNISNIKEPAIPLADESSDDNIMLNYDNDDDELLSEEEVTEDIQYSNTNKFKDYSAPK